MKTTDLITALRDDIKSELREEILSELKPEIERRLYANVFNVSEAMKYLNVSETTLRRMVKDGEIPHFRQRNLIYFRQIDLDKHIAEKVKRTKGA